MTRLEELIEFYSRPLTVDPCDELRVDADTALETAEYLKKLYKPYESRKKLPCTCGRKRIDLWHTNRNDWNYMFKCRVCGKQAGGKTEIAAIRAWNEMIMNENEKNKQGT